MNFSLGKTFTVWEQVKLQIRADAKNVLNHPSFGLPTTDGNQALSSAGCESGWFDCDGNLHDSFSDSQWTQYAVERTRLVLNFTSEIEMAAETAISIF